MKEQKSRKALVLGLILIAVLAALVAVIYFCFRPKTQTGAKNVTIEVIDSSGEKTSYSIETDAQYLKEAMDDAKDLSYETDATDMVMTVNGETADYSADQAYWAFYVNGEYCNYGIAQQPVADRDKFTIEYTKG